MKGIDCIITLVGGVVIGAAVAMLLTPCCGKEMREKLCELLQQCKKPCHCGNDAIECATRIKVDDPVA